MKHKRMLKVINEALEEKSNKYKSTRAYLGASSIGHECERYLWLGFRKAYKDYINYKSAKHFADGHYSEDVFAERMINADIKLQTIDKQTGRQFAVSDCGGWFRGHKDGLIEDWDVYEDGNGEDYVWEHKCSGKLTAMLKYIKEDETTALRRWNEIYFYQAQAYMHHSGIHKHLTTVSPEGTRDGKDGEAICETLYDPSIYAEIKTKSERIITSDKMPTGICGTPTFFKAKFCGAKNVCFGNYIAGPNCNNCMHVTFKLDGDRKAHCAKNNGDFTNYEQMGSYYNCHRFNPDLIQNHDAVSIDDNGDVMYRSDCGKSFVNGEGKGAFTSMELHYSGSGEGGIIYDDVINTVRDVFDGKINSEFK